MLPGPLAPVTATASHSPPQRGVWPSVTKGNAPSPWYSVWTPSPQLPGNSQVCSSSQLPGNSQVGLAHYKRGYLPPLSSLTLLLLLLPLAPWLPLFLNSLPRSHHVAMADLYFSTLFLSPRFSASTTINALKPWIASSHRDLLC